MLELTLIRHFKTKGNLEGRYIGTTDEPLCREHLPVPEGQLRAGGIYPPVELVFSSPLKRCLETAALIYPELPPIVSPGFRECDFGAFENKNYEELKSLTSYQNWLDSEGELPFPGGEPKKDFKERCVLATDWMLNQCKEKNCQHAALVVHGGTIMSILDHYSNPHEDFYHWQVSNGKGFQVTIKDGIWRIRTL